MLLAELQRGLRMEQLAPGNPAVLHLTHDSREVVAGSLFVARVGARVDGHARIEEAVARGAVAVVGTRREALAGLSVPALLVSEEGERWVGELAAAFYGNPFDHLTVIGVTGTNGKTTTACMVQRMLDAVGLPCGYLGTIGYRFGSEELAAANTTPDGLLLHRIAASWLARGARAIVMEVSSHGLALGRVGGVHFDLTGFTNLTPDHLDFHGDMESYFAAKRSLFVEERARSIAAGKATRGFVCAVDGYADRLLALEDAGLVGLTAKGAAGDAEGSYWTDAAGGLLGQPFSMRLAGQLASGRLPMPGAYNLANAALAVALAQAASGAPLQAIVAALDDFAGVPGRFELVARPRAGEPAIYRDYAHTPDAVDRAASLLAASATAGSVIVLGCGGDRDRIKRAPMLAAALRHLPAVVVTSDNPRTESAAAIAAEMCEGLTLPDARVTVELDRGRAIAAGLALAEGSGSGLLIAGKGHEAYQEITGSKFHFDDGEEARRALAARRQGLSFDEVPLVSGWSPERWAAALRGRLLRRGHGGPYGPLTTDSRKVERDGIFVALRGDRFDAHDFLGQVVAQQAGLLITDRAVDLQPGAFDVVQVADTTAAMGHLAAAVVAEARARQGGLRLLAVTGSNGKTTSKELLALIVGLLSGRPPLATRGNLNNHLGVPLTVARLAAADRFAVIEMGASQPGDIATLAGWVAPDVGLITNIGYAHTEGLGGLDGVRLVKSGIREGGRCAHLCIPEAERALPWWIERAAAVGAALHGFGSGEGAESRFTRAQLDGPVTLTLDGRSFTLPLPLPGLHNAANLAGALHAAWLLTGQHPADHAEALATAIGALVLPGGRLRRVVAGGRQIVDDAYNANPSSVVASLTLLAAEPANRVAVLGDMMELGADEEAQHRTVGRLAAEAADCVVAVGRRAAWIADGAAGAPRVVHHATNEAAAGWLAREIPAGSVVWVKGSRSMKMEEIVSRLEAAWGVP